MDISRNEDEDNLVVIFLFFLPDQIHPQTGPHVLRRNMQAIWSLDWVLVCLTTLK